MRESIAAFQTLADVGLQGRTVEDSLVHEITELFLPTLRLEQIVEILPGNGQLGYYRGVNRYDGSVWFIKSVALADRVYYQRVAAIEARIAHAAECVLPPLEPEGRINPANTCCYFLWPYVANAGVQTLDTQRASTAGRALAGMHRALAQMEDVQLIHDGRTRRDEVRRFTRQATMWSKQPLQLPDSVVGPFKHVMQHCASELAELSGDAFWSAPSQVIHGDLNLGNLIYPEQSNGIFVIDFEEALSNYLPRYFDIAFFLERNILFGPRDKSDKQALAYALVEGYQAAAQGDLFPTRDALNLALVYSLARSLYVLVSRARQGFSTPDTEWQKLDQLRVIRTEYRTLLHALTGC